MTIGETDTDTDTGVGAGAVVARFYRAAGSGDFETVRSLLAPDVVLTEPASVPYGGVFEGRDAVVQAAMDLFTKYLNLSSFEVQFILAEGENAIARLNVAGSTHTSGKPIAFSAAEHFVVRDGQVISIQPFHWDTAELIEALRP